MGRVVGEDIFVSVLKVGDLALFALKLVLFHFYLLLVFLCLYFEILSLLLRGLNAAVQERQIVLETVYHLYSLVVILHYFFYLKAQFSIFSLKIKYFAHFLSFAHAYFSFLFDQ